MNKLTFLIILLVGFTPLITFDVVHAIQFSHYGDTVGDSQSTNQGYNNLEISMLYNQTTSLHKIIDNQQQEINLLTKLVSELKK